MGFVRQGGKAFPATVLPLALMALIVLAGCILWAPEANATVLTTVTLEQNGSPVSTLNVPVSSTFTLELWVRNIPEGLSIVGLDFYVSWDPTQVEYLSHTANVHGFQHTYGPPDPKAAGSLWFTCPIDTGIEVSEDDWWLTITFHCLGEGSSQIEVTSIDTIWLWDGETTPSPVLPAPFVVTCNQFKQPPPARPYPVGGLLLSVNKLLVLAPYLVLAGLVATVSAVYLVRRRRH